MSGRRLKLEQALDALPELDDLLPIREALIGASAGDAGRVWAASESYSTLDTRLADGAAVAAQLRGLVAREGERIEAVYRSVVGALRSLEAGDLAEVAAALIAAGEVEEEAGRANAAEGYYRKARELGRKPRDRRSEGLAMRRLGRLAKSRGDLTEALEWYRRGFEVAEAQREAEGMVVACQGMGNVYVDQGRWALAGEWYRKGLELYRAELPGRLLWQLQVNLSIVERRTGDLAESRRWLDRGRESVERLADAEGFVYVRNAEGRLRVAEGDVRGAEAVYLEAIAAEGGAAARGTVLVNLAECLLLQGRVDDSERVVRELERLAVANRILPLLPHVYRAMGAVARARRDEEGFLFYEQALALCQEPEGVAFERALTQEEYGGFEADLGRWESAAARLAEAEVIYRRLGTAAELERTVAAQAAVLERMNAGDVGERDRVEER